jgi:error-prone DNA polymerase
MEALRGKLREHGVKDSPDLDRLRNRQTVAVAGLVVVRQRPATAKGTLFLLLEDEHGFINVIVPDKLVDPNERVVKQAQFMLVRGRGGSSGCGDQCAWAGVSEAQVIAARAREPGFSLRSPAA